MEFSCDYLQPQTEVLLSAVTSRKCVINCFYYSFLLLILILLLLLFFFFSPTKVMSVQMQEEVNHLPVMDNLNVHLTVCLNL